MSELFNTSYEKLSNKIIALLKQVIYKDDDEYLNKIKILFELLQINGIVAGSAVVYANVDFIKGYEVNDIDVFFNNLDKLKSVISQIKNLFDDVVIYFSEELLEYNPYYYDMLAGRYIESYIDDMTKLPQSLSVVNIDIPCINKIIQLIYVDYTDVYNFFEITDMDYTECAIHKYKTYFTDECLLAHKTRHITYYKQLKDKRINKAVSKGFHVVGIFASDIDMLDHLDEQPEKIAIENIDNINFQYLHREPYNITHVRDINISHIVMSLGTDSCGFDVPYKTIEYDIIINDYKFKYFCMELKISPTADDNCIKDGINYKRIKISDVIIGGTNKFIHENIDEIVFRCRKGITNKYLCKIVTIYFNKDKSIFNQLHVFSCDIVRPNSHNCIETIPFNDTLMYFDIDEQKINDFDNNEEVGIILSEKISKMKYCRKKSARF